ncbi:mitochondrial ribosomal protein L37-domain-containing protein [Aspergillus crustosus]
MNSICNRCRSSILTRLQHPTLTSSSWAASQRIQFRSYSDGKPTVAAAPPPPEPRQTIGGDITIPSAISSATPGVSQPLSTPDAVHVGVDTQHKAAQRPASSCPPGTRLSGLNYFKNKPEVVALDDSEYPEWLWSLLEDSQKSAKKGGVDPSTLNKAQRKKYDRRIAAKRALEPRQIPIHHQATDLTPAPYNRSSEASDLIAEAAESLEKRGEITKSAREARRKAIREDNFLRGL